MLDIHCRITVLWRVKMNSSIQGNMYIIQYVGYSCFKDKRDQKSYRIYFNPETYPINEELSTLSSTPDDATITQQTQRRFKSSAYMKLSRDLRKACGHCGFNIIQNSNQKFNLKILAFW